MQPSRPWKLTSYSLCQSHATMQLSWWTCSAGRDIYHVAHPQARVAPALMILQRCSASSRCRCRSVVVGVRGTATMEDIVTDSVAQPEPLQDWLPEDIHKVSPLSELIGAIPWIPNLREHMPQTMLVLA